MHYTKLDQLVNPEGCPCDDSTVSALVQYMLSTHTTQLNSHTNTLVAIVQSVDDMFCVGASIRMHMACG